MAVVNIDLSEYDMLREAKAKAEAENAELKKELENLKNHTACVVKTRYFKPKVDYKVAVRRATEEIRLTIMHNRYMTNGTYDGISPQPIYNEMQMLGLVIDNLDNILRTAIEEGCRNSLYTPNIDNSYDGCEVAEIRGFDDVREEITKALREKYEKSYEDKQNLLDKQIDIYNKKYLKVESEIEASHNAELKNITDRYEKKITSLNDKITELNEDKEKLEQTIADNDSEIKQLSRSHETKVAEAQRKVDEAEAELEALKLQAQVRIVETPIEKKGLFSRLFG